MNKINELRQKYPMTIISKSLKISRSGIYNKLKCQDKDIDRLERFRQKYLHLKIKFDELCRKYPKYGYRRIRIMLRREYDIYMSKKTAQWIMRAFNLTLPVVKKRQARKRYKKIEVIRPNQLWQTDMTKVWVNNVGWMSLFAVIDCFTREIVGLVF